MSPFFHVFNLFFRILIQFVKSLIGLRGATEEREDKVPFSLDQIAKPFDKQFNLENPIKINFRKFINICLHDKNNENSLNTKFGKLQNDLRVFE